MLVFGLHLHVIEFFGPGPVARCIKLLFGPGSVGVSFFFILSGFVLMWASPRGGFSSFWWRRFARIYPLHLATAFIVLGFLFMHSPEELPRLPVLLANLTLVQSWSPDVAVFQSVNTVSWTLSCEAFFYMLFPVLAFSVARLRVSGLVTTAAGAWGVTVAGPILLGLVTGAETARWFFHWTPLGRLPEFICGVALACAVRAAGSSWHRTLASLWCAAVMLTASGYLLAAFVGDPLGEAACTMPGFALLMVAAAVSDVRGIWTPWRNSAMVRFGELSFAFYLVHVIVVRILEVFVGYHPKFEPVPATALTMLTFTLSLGTAWLLNVWVERPTRDLLLRRPTWSQRQAQAR